jgi:hypothetical protein
MLPGRPPRQQSCEIGAKGHRLRDLAARQEDKSVAPPNQLLGVSVAPLIVWARQLFSYHLLAVGSSAAKSFGGSSAQPCGVDENFRHGVRGEFVGTLCFVAHESPRDQVQ